MLKRFRYVFNLSLDRFFPSKSFVSVAESKKSQPEERRVEAPPVQQQPQPSRLQQQRPPTKVQKTTTKGKDSFNVTAIARKM